MDPPSLLSFILTSKESTNTSNSPRYIKDLEGEISQFVQIGEFELLDFMAILTQQFDGLHYGISDGRNGFHLVVLDNVPEF